MGLDMYLRAQRYVSGYEFQGEEKCDEYRKLVELFGVREFVDPDTPSAYVEFTVAYWRKANQVHNWFVQNVQGGVDECQEAAVSREQLEELRTVCLRVLGSTSLVDGTVFNGEMYSAEHPEGVALQEKGKIVSDPRLAHDLLPTQPGFFFGNQDYDQWYWQDVEETVKQIDRVLKLPDEWTFIYQSSW